MTQAPTSQPMASWLEDVWLERYLRRQLAAAEVEWFETYMLDKPALLERVDRDTDLRDALAAAAAQREPMRSEPAPVSGATSVVELRRDVDGASRSSARGPWLAWAASLVVALGMGAMVSRQLSPTSVTPEVIASPTRVVFEIVRGDDDLPAVYPGDPTSSLVLVEADVPTDATDITFIDAAGGRYVLQRGSDGYVSVLVPRSLLIGRTRSTIEYRWQGSLSRRELTVELPPPK